MTKHVPSYLKSALVFVSIQLISLALLVWDSRPIEGEALSLGIVLMSLALSAFICLVLLGITLFFSHILDYGGGHMRPFTGSLILAVDEKKNVYLLKRNSVKIIHIHPDVKDVSVVDNSNFGNLKFLQPFTIETDYKDNVFIRQPGASKAFKVGYDGEVSLEENGSDRVESLAYP